MKRSRPRQEGLSAIELIEEAVYLLRLCPGSAFVSYFAGTVPFVLGLLYFWSDMSRSAFAGQHCVPAALGLALLYGWMKCWQAVFVHGLRARLAGRAAPAWTWRQGARLILAQTALQPTSLFVLPVALLITLPFAWVYAFYQNVSVVGDGSVPELRIVASRARQLASAWPKQNHLIVLFLGLFGVFVFLNLAVALFWLPHLVRTLFGLETAFSKSNWAWLNTTFLAAALSLTCLCLGPLVKAVYTVRCFYGDSLQTGQDLLVDLERVTRHRAATWMTVVWLAVGCAAAPGRAADNAPNRPSPAASVSAPELDRALSEVIQRREYAWRLPRERRIERDDSKGPFTLFFEGVTKTVGDGVRWLVQRARRAVDWVMERWLKRFIRSSDANRSGTGWVESLYVVFFVLLAALLAAVAVLGLRLWRRQRRTDTVVRPAAILPTPDLHDEAVAADRLPADRWLDLAQDLLARGEWRLALRALYLASLALLAQRELLAIARFKSNRDYQLELERRAHAAPDLVAAFARNVLIFDRVWYGKHEVTTETISQFSANLEQLKTGGTQ